MKEVTKMERKLEAILGITALVAICAAGSSVYAVYRLSDLGARVEGLEEMMVPITVGVTIDYGDDNFRIEQVSIVCGATALDALEKIVDVQTTYYPTAGTYFIDAIDDVANNSTTGEYWMFYIWNAETSEWKQPSKGAGLYILKNMENIMFKYEIPTW